MTNKSNDKLRYVPYVTWSSTHLENVATLLYIPGTLGRPHLYPADMIPTSTHRPLSSSCARRAPPLSPLQASLPPSSSPVHISVSST